MRKLNLREKILLLVFGLVIIPVFAIRYGLYPYLEEHWKRQENISLLKKNIEILEDYKNKSNNLSRQILDKYPLIERRILASVAAGTSKKPKLRYLDEKAKEKSVEFQLNNLQTEELSRIVYHFENSKPKIVIETLKISSSTKDSINVHFIVRSI